MKEDEKRRQSLLEDLLEKRLYAWKRFRRGMILVGSGGGALAGASVGYHFYGQIGLLLGAILGMLVVGGIAKKAVDLLLQNFVKELMTHREFVESPNVEIVEEKAMQREEDGLQYVPAGRYMPSFMQEKQEVEALLVSPYLVTQEEWEELMGEEASSFEGDRLPVAQISWGESLEYCNRLSKQKGLQPVYKLDKEEADYILRGIFYADGREVSPEEADFAKTEGYRLPTELEWEYFARAGGYAGSFAGDRNINKVAWFKNNAGTSPHPVGKLQANAFGLYDCSGNLWEYCYDTAYDQKIPAGKNYVYQKEHQDKHRLKGGSYKAISDYCELSFRSTGGSRENHSGMRIVRTA